MLKFLGWLIGAPIAFLFLLAVFSGFRDRSGGGTVATQAVPAAPGVRVGGQVRSATLQPFSYKLSWSRHYAQMTAKLKNNNPFPIKDIAIFCLAKAKSGTHLGNWVRTAYILVEPGEEATLPALSVGPLHEQVANMQCELSFALRAG